jgi:hypothetical protein
VISLSVGTAFGATTSFYSMALRNCAHVRRLPLRGLQQVPRSCVLGLLVLVVEVETRDRVLLQRTFGGGFLFRTGTLFSHTTLSGNFPDNFPDENLENQGT